MVSGAVHRARPRHQVLLRLRIFGQTWQYSWRRARRKRSLCMLKLRTQLTLSSCKSKPKKESLQTSSAFIFTTQLCSWNVATHSRITTSKIRTRSIWKRRGKSSWWWLVGKGSLWMLNLLIHFTQSVRKFTTKRVSQLSDSNGGVTIGRIANGLLSRPAKSHSIPRLIWRSCEAWVVWAQLSCRVAVLKWRASSCKTWVIWTWWSDGDVVKTWWVASCAALVVFWIPVPENSTHH